jgi:hypothetical protein
VLDRRDNLTVARAIYRGRAEQFVWSRCALERACRRGPIGPK